MVSSVLNNAASGLRMTQTLLGTTTRNIINAGTEGYTRKTQQTLTGPAGGVLTGPVRRSTDELLNQQLRTYTAARSGAETLANALERVDRVAGDPQRGDSLSGRMSALSDSLQQLATDPISPLGYQNVISEAESLAATFRESFYELERISRETKTAVPEDVATANGLVERVAGINRQVAAAGSLGKDDTDLLDQRDQLVGQLSEIIGIRSFTDQRNVLHLYTADNKLLADEGAYKLSADIDGNVMAGSEKVHRIGGRIGARQELIEGIVPALNRQLDDLAGRLTSGLATAARDAELAGRLTPPLTAADVTLFNDGGTVAFDPADPVQAAGYAARIAVHAGVAADTSRLRGGTSTSVGDTSLLVANRQVLVGDAHAFTAAGLPANSTLTIAAATFVGNVSSRTASARDDADGRQVAEELVRSRVAQVSDVSIDEEMSRMIELQTAYAANARVMQTAQSMLDELLNVVR